MCVDGEKSPFHSLTLMAVIRLCSILSVLALGTLIGCGRGAWQAAAQGAAARAAAYSLAAVGYF